MNEIQAEREDILEIDTISKPLFKPNQASQSLKYEKITRFFSEY